MSYKIKFLEGVEKPYTLIVRVGGKTEKTKHTTLNSARAALAVFKANFEARFVELN